MTPPNYFRWIKTGDSGGGSSNEWPESLNDGWVSHYNFDTSQYVNTGTGVITDAHGSVNGTTAAGSSISYSTISGTLHAAAFGDEDRLEFGANHEFSGSCTFSFWINNTAEATGNHAPVLGIMANGSSYRGYRVVEFGNTSRTIMKMQTNDGSWRSDGNLFKVPLDQWCHIIIVSDGDESTENQQIKGYVNGVLAGTDNLADDTQMANGYSGNTLPFFIGNRDGDNDYWNGQIADVRIWNRALSSDEVSSLWNYEDAEHEWANGDKINFFWGHSQSQDGLATYTVTDELGNTIFTKSPIHRNDYDNNFGVDGQFVYLGNQLPLTANKTYTITTDRSERQSSWVKLYLSQSSFNEAKQVTSIDGTFTTAMASPATAADDIVQIRVDSSGNWTVVQDVDHDDVYSDLDVADSGTGSKLVGADSTGINFYYPHSSTQDSYTTYTVTDELGNTIFTRAKVKRHATYSTAYTPFGTNAVSAYFGEQLPLTPNKTYTVTADTGDRGWMRIYLKEESKSDAITVDTFDDSYTQAMTSAPTGAGTVLTITVDSNGDWTTSED